MTSPGVFSRNRTVFDKFQEVVIYLDKKVVFMMVTVVADIGGKISISDGTNNWVVPYIGKTRPTLESQVFAVGGL